jgi:cytochrome b6-f complex iron-sulfur subunit
MIPLFRTLFGVLLGGLVARIAALASRLHASETSASQKIARRGFVRNAALGAVVVILAQLGAGTVRLLWPNKTGAFGKELTVSKDNIPAVEGEPFRNTEGKFYLVHTADGLMALYWKCPHLGCTVPWVAGEGQFHCPCHGSIYAYNGNRLGGPAPRPMDYMTVSIASTGDVVVDTGDIHTRSEYEPSQAVPV